MRHIGFHPCEFSLLFAAAKLFWSHLLHLDFQFWPMPDIISTIPLVEQSFEVDVLLQKNETPYLTNLFSQGSPQSTSHSQ